MAIQRVTTEVPSAEVPSAPILRLTVPAVSAPPARGYAVAEVILRVRKPEHAT